MTEPTLTDAEREWFDSWATRCDADPSLQRHEGYLELAEDILAFRVAEAVARERAAWATKVEALADEWVSWAETRSTPRIDAFRDAGEQWRLAIAALTAKTHPHDESWRP